MKRTTKKLRVGSLVRKINTDRVRIVVAIRPDRFIVKIRPPFENRGTWVPMRVLVCVVEHPAA